MNYIAFLYKDNESEQYNAIVPDVEGAYTYGNDFIHTVTMAKEVLELSLEDLTTLPNANALEYFTSEKLKELDIPTNAIPQVIEYSLAQKKRITVNLNLSSLNIIDNFMKNNNIKNRSLFLEESALKVATA